MQKGLKKSGNIAKDIYNTYVKQNKEKKEQTINKDGDNMIDVQINQENTEDTKQESKLNLNEEDWNELVKRIEELVKERDDLKDQLLRKVAEFENYKRRTQKEKEDLIEFANADLLYKLLNLYDNIEKATESAKKSKDLESLLTGLDLIQQQAKRLLEDEGVKEIGDEIGNDFDVNLHDALMVLDSELPAGKIVQVFQKGYRHKDKILRHSKVATSKETE